MEIRRTDAEVELAISKQDGVCVFSLADGRPLAERIRARLGIAAGEHEERDFEDGEHKIRPLQSVRGRDVYVVQSVYGDDALTVNDRLVRLLFFLGALRDAGAERLTAVVPYLCYSRKDRRTKPRDPVTTRYVAELFEAVGTDRIVTVDVHNPVAFQNAFRIPTEHLSAVSAFAEMFRSLVGDRTVVVMSPDMGGAKRAERFRQLLERRLDRPVASAFLEKHRSEGRLRGGTVVGEVRESAVIILDDLIAGGSTLARAASACLASGAERVYAAATHGVFSSEANRVLGTSELERIAILDTVPPIRLDEELLRRRFQVLDCAPLLASAISRLHANGSLIELGDLEDER